ncbi:MAG: gamma-glutamyltransferase, partial [Emcibacteraceae bacterium]|nr:gamma-glutamyltransferase [Emcibacteraceae bacterium]
MTFSKKLFLLFTFIVVGCGEAEQQSSSIATEEAPRPVGMVVTANPLATEAGLEILRAGGSAMDAAVAVEATLSLVEPQSSGLGGGGFMVHYDADTKMVEYYNGREKAPMGATKELFFDADGNKLSSRQAKNSGLSIGTPGAVAVLNMAHKDHGKLAWIELFAPAMRHSVEGFPVSPRMHSSIIAYGDYFYKDVNNG